LHLVVHGGKWTTPGSFPKLLFKKNSKKEKKKKKTKRQKIGGGRSHPLRHHGVAQPPPLAPWGWPGQCTTTSPLQLFFFLGKLPLAPMNYHALAICPHELPTATPDPSNYLTLANNLLPSVNSVETHGQRSNR
jgi:hypothetical protein